MDINQIIDKVDGFVWGWVLIVLIIGTGILLTVRTKAVQVLHLGRALKFMFSNEEGGEGEVTSFGALCTALSATIGTGNIVGVATAIAAGGPGALLWMLIAAFFGMATKYAEGLLAVKYRTIDEDGHALGGPFYYIERGLKESCSWCKNWKWLGKLFAFFGALAGIMGIGTITQINGITSAANRIFKAETLFTVGSGDGAANITLPIIICGAVVTICVALVVLGGIKRIAKVSEVIVPFMAVAYILFALIVVVYNFKAIPAAVVLICKSAFIPKAALGGALGITLKMAIQKGVGRGIFSNESGLGSAPIAAAAAQTKSCVRQGLVSMTGTFIDTIIICTMTGLSIVLTGAWEDHNITGFDLTATAWSKGLPFGNNICVIILSVCLAFFAFTTILGWDYYSERCLEYLIGGKKKGVLLTFRVLYIIAVGIGPYLTVAAVWNIADIFNGLMAFPNLVALVLLSGVVGRETTKYFKENSHALKK